MNELLRRMGGLGVMPVISLPRAGMAEPLAEALARGGLPAAEIGLRTEAAVEGIARMRKARPDMLVGAGTVLTLDQAQACLDAGARFIVAPGYDDALVDFCLERGVPVIPGICTASELTRAVNKGLAAVKFFPAEAMGGLKTLKALAGPFADVLFMPTGGVNPGNMADYLAWERILTVGGTWLAKKDVLERGDFDEIARLAREAMDIVAPFRP